MTWGGAAVLALVLTGCVGSPFDALSAPEAGDDTSASTSKEQGAKKQNDTPIPAEDKKIDEAGSQLTCHWDVPAVKRMDQPAEVGQEGDPANILGGAWQQVGYDDDGYTSFMKKEYRDYRFFFDGNEFLFCQDTPETDKGERRGTVELNGTELELKPDDGTYTLLSWSADSMTWLNHFDDSAVYLVRR